MSTPTTAAIAEHTYPLAHRLRGIASDSLHAFEPGLRELRIDTLPDQLQLTARYTTHSWGISVQVWARDEQGVLQAGAEATAGSLDEVSPIHSRIKHFRSSALLWTHAGLSLNVAPINVLAGDAYTAIGRHCYQLHPEPRIGEHPIWHLATEDLDVEHPLFAGVASALTYIDARFEKPTPHRRPRKTSTPTASHPWRR